jgi:hypothetical protein
MVQDLALMDGAAGIESEDSIPRCVLVVANRTAATPGLLSTIARRAEAGPVRFHLLVPATPQGLHRLVDPEVSGRAEAKARLEAALPKLGEAAGAPVTGEVGDADPIAAIHDALFAQRFDEIIVSTLPRRVSRWLRLDLPSKARGFGLPVTHVEGGVAKPAPEPAMALASS